MKKRTLFVAILAAGVLLVPGAVYASHQFNDVPDDHIFHNSIDWFADQGITVGCNAAGTEFCPNRDVTRGQMATFMKRFHDRFITGSGTSDSAVGLGNSFREEGATPHQGNGVVTGLSLNLNIPQSGVVVVSSSIDASNTSTADVFVCGINTGGSPGLALSDTWRTVDLSAATYGICTTETAFAVSPGSQTVRLVIAQAAASTQIGAGSITAVLYTNSGFFGLLGDGSPDQVEPEPLSDTPKSG